MILSLMLPIYRPPQVGLQLDNLRLDPSEEMRLGPAARAALSHARDQWARGLPPSLPAVRASLRLGGHGYDVLEALLERIDEPVGSAVGGSAGDSAGGSAGGGAGGAGGAGGGGGAAESFAAAAAAVASLENWLIKQASKCSKCSQCVTCSSKYRPGSLHTHFTCDVHAHALHRHCICAAHCRRGAHALHVHHTHTNYAWSIV